MKHVGWVLGAQAIAMTIIAPFSGHFSDKIGFKIPSFLGMMLTFTSLIMLSFISVSTPLVFIIIAIILFGFGAGLFQSPNNVSILESAPIEKSGSSGSIIATVRNFGRASGIALCVLIFSNHYTIKHNSINETHAVSHTFFISTFLAALGVLIVSFRFIVKKDKKR